MDLRLASPKPANAEATTINGMLKEDVKAPLNSNQIKSRQAYADAGGGLQP
jgi:hypothetical protein